ncbi:electron transfer flavoprotein subunit alpha/FixB family protein [Peptoniphilus raoultii]|uniref:electron transfer flavoprotein subunit alpha/FixB family protein n=1 Tax=Peptoniphilus raoultii TaxID=1776387 RepID=UPI0008DAD688|nr:electron transfer flavoprotein subunit alpha/FixB family protein [Peptoniphilus raoultii]
MANNIWVFIEEEKNDLSELSKEIMNKARKIADDLKKDLTAVIFGPKKDEICQKSIFYGANKVLYVNNKNLEIYRTLPYEEALNKLIDKYKPHLILFSATFNSRELAARICAGRKIGLVAECSDLDIDEGDIKFIRPTFDGKLYSDIRITTSPLMATIGGRAFLPAKENDNLRGAVIKEDLEISDDLIVSEILNSKELLNKIKDISKAKIIVAGGMGIGESKNWHLIEEFADAVGGHVAASKPVCDLGICPSDYQIGVSGNIVKPDIYFAIGISGAIQHLNGMKNSKLIIAINNDPKAPILQVSHYCIVADLFEILPKLTEKLKNK